MMINFGTIRLGHANFFIVVPKLTWALGFIALFELLVYPIRKTHTNPLLEWSLLCVHKGKNVVFQSKDVTSEANPNPWQHSVSHDYTSCTSPVFAPNLVQFVENGEVSQACFSGHTDQHLPWKLKPRPSNHPFSMANLMWVSGREGFFTKRCADSANGQPEETFWGWHI